MNKKNLINRYMNLRTQIHGFAWSIVGDYQIAEDVFQEVSMIVLNQQEKYQEGTNFRAWVMEIARRTALYHRRKLARSHATMPEEALINLRNAFAQMESDDQLHVKCEALQKCLKRIKPEQRDLLELRYVKNQPLANMARRFGSTIEGLRSRIRRVREILFRCVSSALSGGKL